MGKTVVRGISSIQDVREKWVQDEVSLTKVKEEWKQTENGIEKVSEVSLPPEVVFYCKGNELTHFPRSQSFASPTVGDPNSIIKTYYAGALGSNSNDDMSLDVVTAIERPDSPLPKTYDSLRIYPDSSGGSGSNHIFHMLMNRKMSLAKGTISFWVTPNQLATNWLWHLSNTCATADNHFTNGNYGFDFAPDGYKGYWYISTPNLTYGPYAGLGYRTGITGAGLFTGWTSANGGAAFLRTNAPYGPTALGSYKVTFSWNKDGIPGTGSPLKTAILTVYYTGNGQTYTDYFTNTWTRTDKIGGSQTLGAQPNSSSYSSNYQSFGGWYSNFIAMNEDQSNAAVAAVLLEQNDPTAMQLKYGGPSFNRYIQLTATNNASAGNHYAYYTIASGMALTVATGDVLEVSLMSLTDSVQVYQGGVDITFSDGTVARNLSMVVQSTTQPLHAITLSPTAKNTWYRFRIPFTAGAVGKSISSLQLVFEEDTPSIQYSFRINRAVVLTSAGYLKLDMLKYLTAATLSSQNLIASSSCTSTDGYVQPTGGLLLDSGMGSALEVNNPTVGPTGMVTGSPTFDGVSALINTVGNYVTYPNVCLGNAFSIQMKIKPVVFPTAAAAYLFGITQNGTVNANYYMYINGSTLYFKWGANEISTAISLSTSAFSTLKVVVNYNGIAGGSDRIRVYNGATQIASSVNNITNTILTHRFFIGISASNTSPFNGYIGSFKIWNYANTELDAGIAYPGLVLFNKMDVSKPQSEVGKGYVSYGDVSLGSSPCKFGNGYKPNLTTHRVEYTNFTSLVGNNCSEFTIEFWMKWDGTSNRAIFIIGTPGDIYDYARGWEVSFNANTGETGVLNKMHRNTAGDLVYEFSEGAHYGNPFVANTLYHFAFVYSSSGIGNTTDKVRYYRDGVVIYADSNASINLTGISALDFNLTFAGWTGSGNYGGNTTVEYLKIWDYDKTDFSDRFVE